ncbi:hypothetical protein AWV80_20125 [Cupriavidus sp. UYMU48A]|nr:hypothetical protein AWV80_20125 [Cupriavidus sp. UYMU48A]
MADAAPEDSELLTQVFFPMAYPRIKAYRAKQGRFAYYTDADTATKILGNREIWMRGTATMNDFDEVNHGLRMLMSCLQDSEAGASCMPRWPPTNRDLPRRPSVTSRRMRRSSPAHTFHHLSV